MLPFVLGLSSALLGAGANLAARSLMQRISPRDFIPVNFMLMALMMLPGVPFFWHFEGGWLTVAILGGTVLLDTLGNFLYFRAFEINNAATASALLSLSPLFTLLLSGLVAFTPSPGWMDALAVLLIVAGTVVLQREMAAADAAADPARGTRFMRLLAPLGAALIFGATILPIKYLLGNRLLNPYTFYFLRAPLIALLAQLFFRPDYRWLTRSTLPLTAGRAVIVLAQWLLLLYALQGGKPATVKAVSDASPLFVLLAGSLFLHEKITRRKAAGVLGVVIGLALLAAGG
ncbi:predicted membrane protein [Longilinea arvoryzae]|uniref:Predicted membrane protein n=1 Tax=Longilinea arvoryzae TaxID=360412 RepID=A0A0S7BNV2_9CHLR|nr:DMT family transporter [Longilinea arvoryzae]GAP15525.1 predicted membrane protein [Longilinea arvoryzae]